MKIDRIGREDWNFSLGKSALEVLTFANVITFIRMGLVFPILILLFWKPSVHFSVPAAVFAFACLTDYLDGYVAKAYGKVSVLGEILDPLADKLLVLLVLCAFVGIGRVHGWALVPAFIIIFREIFVLGLRGLVARFNSVLSVIPLARWKTGVQMTGIFLFFFPSPILWSCESEAVLWSAGVLTGWTGALYSYRAIVLYRIAGRELKSAIQRSVA